MKCFNNMRKINSLKTAFTLLSPIYQHIIIMSVQATIGLTGIGNIEEVYILMAFLDLFSYN